MREAHLESTLAKLSFILENMWDHTNSLTATISVVALGTLILMRYAKSFFPKVWWIYRMPEVLVVVGLSTCESLPFSH